MTLQSVALKYLVLVCSFGLLGLTSCKSKRAILSETQSATSKPLPEILQKHYTNYSNFTTANFRARARYEDNKQTQNVTAEVRIKKDEKILIIIRFFGITMAKALITPENVSYFEKINGKYFEGNYSLLSNWLGTDLDYQKVQNLLLGYAIDDLRTLRFSTDTEKGLYVVKANAENAIAKTFMFESTNALLKKEVLSQKMENRSLEINYPTHLDSGKGIFPSEIFIEAFQKDKVSIKIAYNNVTFNEDLSFSYEVPAGFEPIFID